jgi:lipoprotein-anchoring transpeptidase ErfK/SrfK
MFRRLLVSVLLLLSASLAAGAQPRPKHRRAAAKPRPRFVEAVVNDPATRPQLARGDSGSAVLRAQILLARAHFSCGEIDGRFGWNLQSALISFQEARGLATDGVLRDDVWTALDVDTAPPLTRVEIAAEDVAGPFVQIPDEMLEKAKLTALSYSSPLEAIAEKYHASPELLQQLNPGAAFDQAGVWILAPNVLVAPPGPAAQVLVSKSKRVVMAMDSGGHILASYPATMGSEHDPLPIGRWKILGVSRNPWFHYNPDLFWDAKEHEKAAIPPGPNNPVGVCWIDLSKPHYGIHGTPEPSQIGKTQSHGCIRLTNWDVSELAQMIRPGTPAVLED